MPVTCSFNNTKGSGIRTLTGNIPQPELSSGNFFILFLTSQFQTRELIQQKYQTNRNPSHQKPKIPDNIKQRNLTSKQENQAHKPPNKTNYPTKPTPPKAQEGMPPLHHFSGISEFPIWKTEKLTISKFHLPGSSFLQLPLKAISLDNKFIMISNLHNVFQLLINMQIF